jgi:hypothetical protein
MNKLERIPQALQRNFGAALARPASGPLQHIRQDVLTHFDVRAGVSIKARGRRIEPAAYVLATLDEQANPKNAESSTEPRGRARFGHTRCDETAREKEPK